MTPVDLDCFAPGKDTQAVRLTMPDPHCQPRFSSIRFKSEYERANHIGTIRRREAKARAQTHFQLMREVGEANPQPQFKHGLAPLPEWVIDRE